MTKQLTLKEINEKIKGEIIGTTNHIISSPEQLEFANENQITFIGHKKY